MSINCSCQKEQKKIFCSCLENSISFHHYQLELFPTLGIFTVEDIPDTGLAGIGTWTLTGLPGTTSIFFTEGACDCCAGLGGVG